MDNKVGNSSKVTGGNEPDKHIATIDGTLALQMLKEEKIKPESIQISDKGIATFQDINGISFRSELTKEQVIEFQQISSENQCISSNQSTPEIQNFSHLNDYATLKSQAGSATTSLSIFDDPDSKGLSRENQVKQIEIKGKNTPDNSWKFNFSMGFNRTKYSDTDMHLKSSRVDATIKDFSFQERTSSDFYNPKNWKQPMDAFRWIDEPTNSFTFSAENKNNVYSLTAFHPKFLKQQYENKHVTGTVDGVAVDKVMPINEEFDGYNNKPGEMNLTRFENTHMQMDWQLGYGRNITLVDAHKYGKLVYTPSVYAGLTSGKHYDAYVKPNAYWDFEDSEDKNRIQGANFAIGNKLKYEYGRANIFVENKFTFSHLEHQFMDGTAKYNMKYNATTFGLGFRLYETKPKPEIPVP